MADETKQERFVRLAEKRVTKALAELRKIGNLAGPTYEYTEKQVKAIMMALERAVRDIADRFAEPCPADNESFSFVDWIVENGDHGIDKELDEDGDDGIETTVHSDENP